MSSWTMMTVIGRWSISLLIGAFIVSSSTAAKPNVQGTCGGEIIGRNGGDIASPGFPDSNYPPLADCQYTITAPTDNVVVFSSTYLDLEPEGSFAEGEALQCFDKILIYRTGNLTDTPDTYCGNSTIYPTATTGNKLIVQFQSDQNTEHGGFVINWYVLNPLNRNPVFNCDFDGPLGLCPGWTQGTADGTDWSFGRGPTPSRSTGPTADHTTGTDAGKYAYLEASGKQRGATAVMYSPTLILNEQPAYCLDMWYHNSGEHRGSINVLRVFQNGDGSYLQILENLDPGWQNARVPLPISELPIQIGIEAVRGRGYKSDVAVDDIMLLAENCEEKNATDLYVYEDCSFICYDGTCKPQNQVCDGLPDCDEGEDELDCQTTAGSTTTEATSSTQISTTISQNCEANLVYMPCGSACAHTCADGEIAPLCTFNCVPGCSCPIDFPILHEGRCITYQDCPATAPPQLSTMVPTTTQTQSTQATTETPTTPPEPQCPANLVFNSCASECNHTCRDGDIPPACTKQCIPRCACPEALPIYYQERCIALLDCPALEAVTGISVDALTINSANVTFPVVATASSFRIIINLVSSSSLLKEINYPNNKPNVSGSVIIKLSNLLPETQYSVQVFSVRGTEQVPSEVFLFSTLPLPTEPPSTTTVQPTTETIISTATTLATTTSTVATTTILTTTREATTTTETTTEAAPVSLGSSSTPKCIQDLQTALESVSSDPSMFNRLPECTNDGLYRSQQCYTDTNECHCVVEETGLEIPGTRFVQGSAEPIDCANLTQCQLQFKNTAVFIFTNPNIADGPTYPDCTVSGLYAPTQCNGLTGVCWCVIPETGATIPQTEKSSRQLLDCSSLTKCQEKYLQTGQQLALNPGAANTLTYPNCSENGLFARKQCNGFTNLCQCVVEETGAVIPGTEKQDVNIDCLVLTKCQTDWHRLSQIINTIPASIPHGLELPECDAEGYFVAKQCEKETDICWCVDPKTGDIVPQSGSEPGQGSQVDCSGTTTAPPTSTIESTTLDTTLQVTTTSHTTTTISTVAEPVTTSTPTTLETSSSTPETDAVVDESCGPGNFTCGSGECISLFYICDTLPDCEDGSDESEETCNNFAACDLGQFACGDKCVPFTARCNGTLECLDGSDELNCQLLGAGPPIPMETTTSSQTTTSTTVPTTPKQQTSTTSPTFSFETSTEQAITSAFMGCNEKFQNTMMMLNSNPSLLDTLPLCDNNGLYMPQQCNTMTNMCWCVVKETGTIIPATEFSQDSGSQIDCSNLSECQKEFEKTAKFMFENPEIADGPNFPDCTPNGLFAPKQCNAMTGACWCVIPETGDTIPITESFDGQALNCSDLTKCQEQYKKTGQFIASNPTIQDGPTFPKCSADGNFVSKQCNGLTGACWCVLQQSGTAIPGTTKQDGLNVNCSELTACQQQFEDIGTFLSENPDLMDGPSYPECNSKGEYLPKQCDGFTGACRCVVPETGDTLPGTLLDGESGFNLNCSTLTKCQNAYLETSQFIHNNPRLQDGPDLPICTDDGLYAPRQCIGFTNVCWCVVPASGDPIPGTQTPPGLGFKLNCSALTICQQLYVNVGKFKFENPELAKGAEFPACADDGMFVPRQCESNGECRCVFPESGDEISGSLTPPGGQLDCSEFLTPEPPVKCGGVFRMQSGFFTSPNYPDTYAITDGCDYSIIRNDTAQYIELYIDDMELGKIGPRGTCIEDRLEIISSERTFSFCQASPPQLQLQYGSDVTARLVPGPQPSVYRGFSIRYKFMYCDIPDQRFLSTSNCDSTCDDLEPPCVRIMVERCVCPPERYVLHEGRCITAAECPQIKVEQLNSTSSQVDPTVVSSDAAALQKTTGTTGPDATISQETTTNSDTPTSPDTTAPSDASTQPESTTQPDIVATQPESTTTQPQTTTQPETITQREATTQPETTQRETTTQTDAATTADAVVKPDTTTQSKTTQSQDATAALDTTVAQYVLDIISLTVINVSSSRGCISLSGSPDIQKYFLDFYLTDQLDTPLANFSFNQKELRTNYEMCVNQLAEGVSYTVVAWGGRGSAIGSSQNTSFTTTSSQGTSAPSTATTSSSVAGVIAADSATGASVPNTTSTSDQPFASSSITNTEAAVASLNQSSTTESGFLSESTVTTSRPADPVGRSGDLNDSTTSTFGELTTQPTSSTEQTTQAANNQPPVSETTVAGASTETTQAATNQPSVTETSAATVQTETGQPLLAETNGTVASQEATQAVTQTSSGTALATETTQAHSVTTSGAIVFETPVPTENSTASVVETTSSESTQSATNQPSVSEMTGTGTQTNQTSMGEMAGTVVSTESTQTDSVATSSAVASTETTQTLVVTSESSVPTETTKVPIQTSETSQAQILTTHDVILSTDSTQTSTLTSAVVLPTETSQATVTTTNGTIALTETTETTTPNTSGAVSTDSTPSQVTTTSGSVAISSASETTPESATASGTVSDAMASPVTTQANAPISDAGASAETTTGNAPAVPGSTTSTSVVSTMETATVTQPAQTSNTATTSGATEPETSAVQQSTDSASASSGPVTLQQTTVTATAVPTAPATTEAPLNLQVEVLTIANGTVCVKVKHDSSADSYLITIDQTAVSSNTGFSQNFGEVPAHSPYTYECFYDILSDQNYVATVIPKKGGLSMGNTKAENFNTIGQTTPSPTSGTKYQQTNATKQWQDNYNKWRNDTVNKWFQLASDYFASFGSALPGISPDHSQCPAPYKPPCSVQTRTFVDYNGCLFLICDQPLQGDFTQEDVLLWEKEYATYTDYLLPQWQKLFDAYTQASNPAGK